MTTGNDISREAELDASEWLLFRQMNIYKYLIASADEREQRAIELLITSQNPDDDVKLRQEITIARDIKEWFFELEQNFRQFYEPERYEPETYDE